MKMWNQKKNLHSQAMEIEITEILFQPTIVGYFSLPTILQQPPTQPPRQPTNQPSTTATETIDIEANKNKRNKSKAQAQILI